MKNLFTRFFAMVMTFMAGLFSSLKMSKSERGRMSKMHQHNVDAYQKLMERLHPYARKFILPVCKRDKNGELIKNKRYRRYVRFISQRKEELLLKRGCKVFEIAGHRIIARNENNAIRKSGILNKLVIS